MGKRWASCLGALIIATTLLSGCQTAKVERDNYPNSTSNQNVESTLDYDFSKASRGNLAGNIANSGYVVMKDEWIYYFDSEKNSIYRVDIEGNNPVKITEDGGFNLNVIDDWIIYSSESDGKIYRVKLDGTKKEKVCDDKSNFLNVLGDWVFYVNESEENRIYKIKLDGSERIKINDIGSTRINVIGEWVYYCKLENENDENGENFYSPFGEIYKVKVDGTENSKISEVKASFLNVIDDWIYYSDVNDGVSLFRMKINGSEVSKIVDGNCYYINVSKDSIFFSDMSSGLYKVDLDGTNKRSIGENGRYMNINLAGEWLYLKLWSGDENGFYRIKNDGTGKTKVSNTAEDIVDIEIGWSFETATKADVNGTEVPTTNISILINDNKTEIGEYLGYPEVVNDFINSGFPENSITACKAWFGGAGEAIYIQKLDNQTLAVMGKNIDEKEDTQNFEKIKEIQLPNKIGDIKVIED